MIYRCRTLPAWIVTVMLAASAGAGAPPSSVHSHHAPPVFPSPAPPFNQGGIAAWPREINRVAVLPLHDTTSSLRPKSLLEYDRIWLGQLQRTERAEFVNLSRDRTDRWFTATSAESTSALPPDLFTAIATETGAQAVVMLDIVYLPQHRADSIGIRVKLIELSTQRILWMADESFDLREGLSRSTIKRFLKGQSGTGQVGNAKVALRQSPSLFAALAFDTTLRHLPPRLDH